MDNKLELKSINEMVLVWHSLNNQMHNLLVQQQNCGTDAELLGWKMETQKEYNELDDIKKRLKHNLLNQKFSGERMEIDRMQKYNVLLEKLSDLEHKQWMQWSKSVATKLMEIIEHLDKDDKDSAIEDINAMIDGWQKNWVEYKDLPDAEKHKDREWGYEAMKIFYNGGYDDKGEKQ